MKLQRYTRSAKKLFASKKVSKAILSEHAAVRSGQEERSGTAGGERITRIQEVAIGPMNVGSSRDSDGHRAAPWHPASSPPRPLRAPQERAPTAEPRGTSRRLSRV